MGSNSKDGRQASKLQSVDSIANGIIRNDGNRAVCF